MKIEIIKAEPKHINEIKQIEIRSKLSPWTIEDYFLETSRSDGLFLVATNGSKIIGFILTRLIMYSTDNSQNYELEIYNIAVEKKFRRHSIATDLLHRAIKNNGKNNIQKVTLEVRKSNIGAQKFYLKHSFEIVGERKNFYSNPPEDAILMCRFMNFI